MNEYKSIIKNTLKGKETGYRYPGEILERCITNTPDKADEVLDGFLEVALNPAGLEMLLKTENAFNSNQIDMFVNHIGNYKAALLKFLLTKEAVPVKEEYLNTVDDYIYLAEYIKILTDKSDLYEALVEELTESFSKIISLLKQSLYDDAALQKVVHYIKVFKLDNKYQKEEKKYLSLIRKATDNVFSDSDIEKLQSYGYSLLKIRKLNAVNMNSYVAGRQDKAWFLFLKEAFLGAEVLSEKEKEIITTKIEEKNTRTGDEKVWVLERAIEGHKCMLTVLSFHKFKETSVNASFCLSFMSEQDCYDMTKNISLKGELFKSLPDTQKNIIYQQCLRYSDDNEKLCYCRDRMLECDPEGQYLARISPNRIIQLVSKGIYTVKELENPNVNIKSLVCEAFLKATKTNIEILRKYANKAPDIFNYMDSQYYYEETKKIFIIKSENLSEKDMKELYEIKENYFFRYAPFIYVKFILNVIRETKTLIHSKKEWLALLEYLEETGTDILYIKKEILTEDEYEEILRERKEKEEQQKRKSLMEQIQQATSAKDIAWYEISKNMLDVKRAACLKILELKDYSYHAEDRINTSYYEDIIGDEEFLKFHKGKKEINKEVV